MSEKPAPSARWMKSAPTEWPQDQLQTPRNARRTMPTVDPANQLIGREAFTYSTTIDIPGAIAAGQVFTAFIPTEQDGDFWCDQIYCTGWNQSFGYQARVAIGDTIDISDARTGKYLTWPPQSVSLQFFNSLILFSDDAGYDPSAALLPDGFRSTSVLPQPFCFTRAGGIQVAIQCFGAVNAGARTIDMAFGGWKEYGHAS